MDFSKAKNKKDEWYTPESAILPILKYLKKGSTIWCPFDKEISNYVKVLKEKGFTVIYSHIEEGKDFFEYEPKEYYDYIVSNPPFSLKNKVFKRVFELNKPFALIMNINGLFDSKIRWSMFSENDFSLAYIKGRVNYMEEYGVQGKSSPPFQSAYVCKGLTKEKLVLLDAS